MCGRYVLFSAMEQLVECVSAAVPDAGEPQVVRTEPLRPNYNVAPTSIVPIVRMFQGKPTIGPAQWGYPVGQPPKPVFNARGETAFEKPLFAGSVPCAFVMDGWYEWVDKQPWFTSQEDGPMLVAGLCTVVDGALYGTIVTVDAVPEMQWLHHRMPRLLLSQDEVSAWLAGGDEMRGMATHIDAELVGQFGLHSRKASRDVGSVRNNHPGLIQE